jgi:hypothetical protein
MRLIEPDAESLRKSLRGGDVVFADPPLALASLFDGRGFPFGYLGNEDITSPHINLTDVGDIFRCFERVTVVREL